MEYREESLRRKFSGAAHMWDTHSIAFSPDRRWLAVTGENSVKLHEVSEDKAQVKATEQ